MTHPDRSRRLVFDEQTNQGDLIVFAGPKKRFSDTLLRNVQADFPEFLPVRYETVDDFLSTVNNHGASCRILIVDLFLCSQTIEDCCDFADRFRARSQIHDPPGLVIAYWDVQPGSQLLARFDNRVNLRGLIPMNLAIDIWLSIVRLLANGGTYFPPELSLNSTAPNLPASPDTAKPKAEAVPHSNTAVASLLTNREIEVLEHLSGGLQNKQIAAKLKLSEHTIKLHIHHIIGKLDVRNRTEAAMKYLTMRDS